MKLSDNDPNSVVVREPNEKECYDSALFAFVKKMLNKPDKISTSFADLYFEAHHFSVTNLNKFWLEFVDFAQFELYKKTNNVFEKIDFSTEQPNIVGDLNKRMDEFPRFFPDCYLNYAENILSSDKRYGLSPNKTVLTEVNELDRTKSLTIAKLKNRVIKTACAFKNAGLKANDVFVSILPNNCFSVVSMLAAASIGGIWTCTCPEIQPAGILMRVTQTNPTVIIMQESVVYNGKKFSQLNKLAAILPKLPTVRLVVIYKPDETTFNNFIEENSEFWKNYSHIIHFKTDFVKKTFKSSQQQIDQFEFAKLPFSQPLFIMYSSGTTGIPKGIVHSAGGCLIQQSKDHILHNNITHTDNFMYYTITSWMMWNWSVTALYTGCNLVLYDGSPVYPGLTRLFDLVDKFKINVLGAGAALYQMYELKLVKENLLNFNLSSLRMLLSTGSVLPAHTYIYLINLLNSLLKNNSLHVVSLAAATDIFSCFAGANVFLPVYAGVVQAANLGMAINSWDVTNDTNTTDQDGELVVCRPFPSMPVYLWNDDASHTKYKDTYFSKVTTNNTSFMNKLNINHNKDYAFWAQGDYMKLLSNTTKSCVYPEKCCGLLMLGRSDTTLNPKGVRFGSAEIYSVIESAIPGVNDCLVVGQVLNDGDERVILFLQIDDETVQPFNDELVAKIKKLIREQLSARHVPEKILKLTDKVPYTATGKKVELAVKKIISRLPYTIQKEALRDAKSLEQFTDMVNRNVI